MPRAARPARTAVFAQTSRIPLAVTRYGEPGAPFLEHTCHIDAQTEDAMYPSPAPTNQPPGIERRGAITLDVDSVRTSAGPYAGWEA